MFTLMSIPNQKRFWDAVERSTGSVFLHLPDQAKIDLKRDHTARELIHLMTPNKGGLQLSLTESSDVPRMLFSLM